MPIPRYAPDELLRRLASSFLSGLPELGELQQPPKPYPAYVEESLQQYQPQGPTAGWTGPEQDITAVGVDEQTPLAASVDIGITGREDAATAKAAEGEAKLQRLKEAAKQAQLDELASLVDDMPINKLFEIRSQASAAGRHGRLGDDVASKVEPQDRLKAFTGGSVSQQPMTPEIQQRLDDNAAWLADAPIRNAEFALTTEQADMRPGQAQLASERLPELQRERALAQRMANQEKLLSGMTSESGKIPFEMAMNAMGQGMTVPHQMIGMSPDMADNEINQLLQAAGTGMMNRGMLDDPEGPNAQFEKHSFMLIQAAKERLAAGGDRDVILPQLRVEIRNLIVGLGLGNVINMQQLNQQLGIPEGQ